MGANLYAGMTVSGTCDGIFESDCDKRAVAIGQSNGVPWAVFSEVGLRKGPLYFAFGDDVKTLAKKHVKQRED